MGSEKGFRFKTFKIKNQISENQEPGQKQYIPVGFFRIENYKLAVNILKVAIILMLC